MNRFQSNNRRLTSLWMMKTHSAGWLPKIKWQDFAVQNIDLSTSKQDFLKIFLALMLITIWIIHPRASYAAPQPQTQSVVSNSETVSNLSGNLLVMGDSLSAAYGIKTEQGWVQLLADKLSKSPHTQSVEVINASISGETTSGGKQRFSGLLEKYQPQWVILELGANDALRGQNLGSTQKNLEKMIIQCQSQQPNCQVLLLGIRLPTNYGPAYDQFLQKIFQDLAKKHQLVFDPFFLEPVALEPDLMQEDGLHPNAKAQPIILKHLWPKIERLLSRQ